MGALLACKIDAMLVALLHSQSRFIALLPFRPDNRMLQVLPPSHSASCFRRGAEQRRAKHGEDPCRAPRLRRAAAGYSPGCRRVPRRGGPNPAAPSPVSARSLREAHSLTGFATCRSPRLGRRLALARARRVTSAARPRGAASVVRWASRARRPLGPQGPQQAPARPPSADLQPRMPPLVTPRGTRPRRARGSHPQGCVRAVPRRPRSSPAASPPRAMPAALGCGPWARPRPSCARRASWRCATRRP